MSLGDRERHIVSSDGRHEVWRETRLPAASMHSSTHGECVLVWVDQGAATVQTETGVERLVAGEALWIPAGAPHAIETEQGSLCFPIMVPGRHVVSKRQASRRLTVPPAWRDWLIHHFTVAISPLRTVGHPQAGLGDLLRAGGSTADPDIVLPLPRTQLRHPFSAALRSIADELLRNPGLAYTSAEWAARAGLSPRTLQRRFLEEVAVTFRQWRTACRLLASTDHLTTGRDMGWVADRVGFASVSGFTRAFRAEFGMTPSTYAALGRTSRGNEPMHAGQCDADVLDLVRLDGIEPQDARGIPASSTPSLVNNFQVIIWMYRGRCRTQVGDRTLTLDTGEAIWLPASVPNRVDVEPDSIMLPIQSAPRATRLSPNDVGVFAIPSEFGTALLGAAVSQYTRLRPPGYDELAGWYAFEDWTRKAPDPEPTAPSAAARTAAMESARRLLGGGMAAGTVAVRLGYSHVSSFSRAFSRTYGVSPRTFQRHAAIRVRVDQENSRPARIGT